jgi:hypothetical protein
MAAHTIYGLPYTTLGLGGCHSGRPVGSTESLVNCLAMGIVRRLSKPQYVPRFIGRSSNTDHVLYMASNSMTVRVIYTMIIFYQARYRYQLI